MWWARACHGGSNMKYLEKMNTCLRLFALALCISCLVFPVLAEDIVWNGAGQPGTTGQLRSEPMWGTQNSLFPNGSSGNSAAVSADVQGHIFGGIDDQLTDAASATNNRIIISGGMLGDASNGDIHGAYAGSSSSSAFAGGNSVTMTGGTVKGLLYGGYAVGFADSAIAENNHVGIGYGTVERSIHGGYAFASGNGTQGAARSNRVFIGGGTVDADVYGGYSVVHNNADGSATGNTVTLSGSPVFGNSSIYGGFVGDSAGVPLTGADAFSGNTLNVRNYTGTSVVDSVQNFQYYNFLLPASLQSLTTSNLFLGDGGSTGSTVTGVNIMGGGTAPRIGDTITLIGASMLVGSLENDGATISGLKGVSLLYDFELKAENYVGLYATVVNYRVNQEAKSLSEGRAASLAFIRQGQDLIVGSGFAAADACIGGDGAGWSKPFFFTAGGGGHSRHKTGSRVDVDGVSMLAGLAWRNNGPCGSLLLGAFFETGYADYDTHNAFAARSVRGDGDSRYFGGGALARYDWRNGFYAEASGRVGGVNNKFHNDMATASGARARYDLDSAYFGAHAGVGYKWRVNEKSLLDFSAKYLWSRQNGDSARLDGDDIRFDANDSHRLRAGVRFTHAPAGCVSPYVGAAFEYELDGKARAGAYGLRYGVPTLKGGTGVGEIGLALRRNSFSADLGVQGHVGRRDGITGSLRVGWKF